MPRRPSKSRSGSPRAVYLLAAMTLLLFLGGELFIMLRTDRGRILAAKLGIGDPARTTQLIGQQIRQGLKAAGVPRDSVRETVAEGKRPAVRWRVGLRPDASPLQVNYAISRSVVDAGGRVFSGRERRGDEEETVTLRLGLGGRPTHEVVLVRSTAPPREAEASGSRLAVVLYGFGKDPAQDEQLFGMSLPFAVALIAGAPESPDLFRAARRLEREVVLSLPLEPINYPQVNPGPGAILVTMSQARIAGMVRRYLDQAGPVAAVANHMGSLATQDMAVMSAIYDELKRDRLPFLHVAPVAGAVCRSLAAKVGVMYGRPDEIIESAASQDRPDALDREWNKVLEQARRHRNQLVMIRATPMVRAWLPKALSEKRLGDVSLVPVSAVLKRPAAL